MNSRGGIGLEMHDIPRKKKEKWEELNSQPTQKSDCNIFLVTTIVNFFCVCVGGGNLLPNFITNKGDQTLPLIKFTQKHH